MQKKSQKQKNSKKYKLIIFDLDGTLINSLSFHLESFKELLLEHNIRMTENKLLNLMGKPTQEILKELKKDHKFSEKIEDLREERRYHYFRLIGKRDLTFPNVKSMLSKLRPNYKLAVATGSSRIIFTHSTDKDFQSNFDYVVTINDVKNGKPFPDQFLKAAKKLKVSPKDCLVIGDSLYDADAARNAKMDFIGVLTGFTPERQLKVHGAIQTLNSASHLPAILNKN